MSFESVEEFWGLYNKCAYFLLPIGIILASQTGNRLDSDTLDFSATNSIVPPSHIAVNANYYLFKAGIKPAWEDPANAEGGKWSIQLPRDKNRETIDKFWLYTVRLGGLDLRSHCKSTD